MLPRDIFINEIKKKMEKDKDIYFLSADFGVYEIDVVNSTNTTASIKSAI